jgi:hypothetical protein
MLYGTYIEMEKTNRVCNKICIGMLDFLFSINHTERSKHLLKLSNSKQSKLFIVGNFKLNHIFTNKYICDILCKSQKFIHIIVCVIYLYSFYKYQNNL